MIRFLAGAILGGLTAWGLAMLRASTWVDMREEDVERRTRPVLLTPRQYVHVRMGQQSRTFAPFDDELLDSENAGA